MRDAFDADWEDVKLLFDRRGSRVDQEITAKVLVNSKTTIERIGYELGRERQRRPLRGRVPEAPCDCEHSATLQSCRAFWVGCGTGIDPRCGFAGGYHSRLSSSRDFPAAIPLRTSCSSLSASAS